MREIPKLKQKLHLSIGGARTSSEFVYEFSENKGRNRQISNSILILLYYQCKILKSNGTYLSCPLLLTGSFLHALVAN